MFDLKKRGLVGNISLCGMNGKKMPSIRQHMQHAIVDAYPKHEFDISCKTFPGDDTVDPEAYKAAIEALPPCSVVTIFTPDDTHFYIAMEAVRAGHHVLVTKPAVKTLQHHLELAEAAKAAGVLVAIEVHKRCDPMYADARDRLAAMGDFSYLNAYMSQPKLQLQTFAAWAGIASDISYYLNSHHIDFHEWCYAGRARPVRVTASTSTGVAKRTLGRPVDDTITLLVQWENLPSGNMGTAVYTSSWIAPTSDVHSQQRFFLMAHGGEVKVDQGHRGYSCATDAEGYKSVNPLFMKYTPSGGKFVGQLGYGYRSFEVFVEAATRVNAGMAAVSDFDDGSLATIATTAQGTAILEAGARSIAASCMPMAMAYGSSDPSSPAAYLPIDISTV